VIWRHRGVVLRYLFFWQTLQNLATSLEILAGPVFHGHAGQRRRGVRDRVVDPGGQQRGFFVPGGLGVQEGGFVLIGGALGLDPATSLALAGARRIRDLLIFAPGLVAWQVAESSANGRPRGRDSKPGQVGRMRRTPRNSYTPAGALLRPAHPLQDHLKPWRDFPGLLSVANCACPPNAAAETSARFGLDGRAFGQPGIEHVVQLVLESPGDGTAHGPIKHAERGRDGAADPQLLKQPAPGGRA
jgi:hypothetical protein